MAPGAGWSLLPLAAEEIMTLKSTKEITPVGLFPYLCKLRRSYGSEGFILFLCSSERRI